MYMYRCNCDKFYHTLRLREGGGSYSSMMMTINILSHQVAAVSGDARRALDIARRATEIAQLEKGVGLVGIPHIDRAVQEMFSSAKIQAIR